MSLRRRANRKWVIVSFLLVWHATVWTSAASEEDETCHAEGECAAVPSFSSSSCGLYLAPSTIPNAGLGIFTTKPLHEGDTVGFGDIAIPLVDQKWHNGEKRFFWPFDDYVWSGDVMGMGRETEIADIEAYCPGLDCAINCNLALINVGKALPVFDTAGLHRSKDPGAGAISPYHNGSTPVVADIPAGGELFKFYGDNWFTTRERMFGLIPLIQDYETANEIVDTFSEFDLSEDGKKDLWKFVREGIPWESRTMNALPNDFHQVDLVARDGIQALHQPAAVRSTDFLAEHGRCLDNLIPGKSTLPQAGRGAFATRLLPKDSIITGSPLLHIPFRSVLDMYGTRIVNGKLVRDVNNVIGTQLLLNYCLGHGDSTLLLCPYGTTVNYINHNQTLANVNIQWAQHGMLSQNASWLSLDVKSMEWQYQTSLAIDYVALRDIHEGEELFLDYGDEFEEKWQNHVKNWNPPPDSDDYAPAAEWNQHRASEPLRTNDEQNLNPYPPNVEVRCHEKLKRPTWRFYFAERGYDDLWDLNGQGWHCVIIARYKTGGNTFLYDIQVTDESSDDDSTFSRNRVPRQAFSFVDFEYSTDIHLENAFRHEIGFPEGMFPDQWRNLQ